jgi:hypothetical protein
MALDIEDFSPRGGVCYGSTTTERDGGIDLAATGDEAPSPAAFAALQATMDGIERLRLIGLAAVVAHRQSVENLRSPPEADWAITSLSANDGGVVIVTFYESEIDTYGDWDVSFRGETALKVDRRQI